MNLKNRYNRTYSIPMSIKIVRKKMHLEKITFILLISAGVTFWSAGKRSTETSRYLEKSYRNKRLGVSKRQTGCLFSSEITCDSDSKYSNFDGSCNNLVNPYYGKAETPLGRLLTPVYEDGSNLPKTSGLPNPREVSLTINSDNGKSEDKWSHIWTTFGQFLTHDILEIPHATVDGEKPACNDCTAEDDNCLPISINSTDALRITCMPFVRSSATVDLDCTSDQREQLNLNTAFIDASQVYGTSVTISNSLRTMEGGNFNFFWLFMIIKNTRSYLILLRQIESNSWYKRR